MGNGEMACEVSELRCGQTRCYLVNRTLLVDTGWSGTLHELFRALKRGGVQLKDVRCLIVTHYHPDHMGIAQELADLGVRLVVLDVQEGFLHSSDYIFAKDPQTSFEPIVDANVLVVPCSESRVFLGGLGIAGEVLHTPGHSDDSVSVVLDGGTAIVGDLPPLGLASAHDEPALKASWNDLLAHGVVRALHAHAPEELVRVGV
ncbi:MAG: MBL fold metallo-hydrolase [Atopobiaceae bacterium]|jgi:glyoxylase-like metal-dependent hydrolase (beta-lactamase superfamily II)